MSSQDCAIIAIRGDDVSRPDSPVQSNAAALAADGIEFFLSENGVWLTDAVPSNYLTPISEPARA